jgi:glycine/D-amino acid oxidase-like deaminating enzyme
MDVVIVGAGIIGAACALYLVRSGFKVQVLEERFPASGTSGACDGIVLLWDKAPGPELELGKLSLGLWADLAEELGPSMEYQRRGSIMLAEADSLDRAAAHAELMRANGVEVQVLDSADLREAEPGLAPDLPGGFLFPMDAQVEPRRATWTMLKEARRLGAQLRLGTRVLGIMAERSGRVKGLWTQEGLVGCEAVVLAGGVHTPALLPDPRTVPVVPRKGHILVVGRGGPSVNHCLLEGGYTETVQSSGSGVQVATVVEPTMAGTLLVGSSRQFAGYDRASDVAVAAAIASRAVRFLPGMAQAKVVRVYAGLRPYSPDHLPIIGPVPGFAGLWVATGHEGAGISLAPATGWLIEGMVNGKVLPNFCRAFDPSRFAETEHGVGLQG